MSKCLFLITDPDVVHPFLDIFLAAEMITAGGPVFLSLVNKKGGYALKVFPLRKRCKSGRSCEQQAHQTVED